MATTKKRHPLQVNDVTYQRIQELSESYGTSKTKIVERAVEHLSNELMLREANAEWEKILQDPEAAEEIAAEQRLWDATLADGLENDPWDSE